MKIDINEPRITAFALGELSRDESSEVVQAMRRDPRLRTAVDEVRKTAAILQQTLSGEEVYLLTEEQRAVVRSAAEGATIIDIASAEMSFWKKPWVVSMGVAAMVSVGLFIFGEQLGGQKIPTVSDVERGWDWSQVDMENLTSPVVLDVGAQGEKGGVRGSEVFVSPVASAMSEDTTNFRKELKRRIQDYDTKSALKLPKLEERDWKIIEGKESTVMSVPLVSGAMSWPLMERYILEMSTLPPAEGVRIEEMVNHFDYQTPSMLEGDGLVADIELCQTPWNGSTLLLGVHVRSVSHQAVDSRVTLTFHDGVVRRVRSLGYSQIKGEKSRSAVGLSAQSISQTQGNYALYELEAMTPSTVIDLEQPLVTLQIGVHASQALSLKNEPVGDWAQASQDLRFASSVAATGMLLSSTSSRGDLSPESLISLLEALESKDTGSISAERRKGVKLLQRAAGLLGNKE